MAVSRITGHIVNEQLGRLVADADMDVAEKVLTFRIPSLSRKGRSYIVEVDLLSCEVACKCEAFSTYREAALMPYRKNAAGTPLEHLARAKGYGLLPLITRAPRGLCCHSRKVRSWLRRHDMFQYFELKEAELMERVADLPARKERRSA